MKRFFNLVPVAVVSVFLLICSCGKKEDKAVAVPQDVKYVESVKTDVLWFYEYSGKVSGAAVQAKVSGALKEKYYKDGQTVEKGAKLFLIDQQQYKDEIVKAKAGADKEKTNFDKAKNKFNKVYAQHAKGSVKKEEYQKALAAFNKAEAEYNAVLASVKEAETNLKNTVILSPAAGIAGPAMFENGTMISVMDGTSILATVSKMNPLKVSFKMPKSEFKNFSEGHFRGKIAADKPITKAIYAEVFTADDVMYPKKGKIVLFDSKKDVKPDIITVSAEFPKQDKQKILLPGQSVRVRIVNAVYKDAVVLPRSCIFETPDGSFVYVIKEGNVIKQIAVNYKSDGDTAFVLSGLDGGEKIVSEDTGKIDVSKTGEINLMRQEYACPEKYKIVPKTDSPQKDFSVAKDEEAVKNASTKKTAGAKKSSQPSAQAKKDQGKTKSSAGAVKKTAASK